MIEPKLRQERARNPLDALIKAFVEPLIIMGAKFVFWLIMHPIIWLPLVLAGGTIYLLGLYGCAGVVVFTYLVLEFWKAIWPTSYERVVGYPSRNRWRRFWVYERKWRTVMVENDMVKVRPGKTDRVPRIKKFESNEYRDRLLVELGGGLHITQLQKIAHKIADDFGSDECRINRPEPNRAWLMFPRVDPLTNTIPAFDIQEEIDLKAVRVGLTDEGDFWTIPILHQNGAHLLTVATTGGGKSGVPWCIIRALCPLIRDGLVQLWVADPKGGVEFKRGMPLWHRYADDYDSIMVMLKEGVAEMDARGKRQADGERMHEPSVEEPIMIFIIDEFLTVTALETSARRTAFEALTAKLLTKGRALGVDVIACSQDATKAMMRLRGFFPRRWLGRVDEPLQVNMILGEGAREQGARCDDETVVPHHLAGVGFVKVEGVREPVRVRSAHVTNDDIAEMVRDYAPQQSVAKTSSDVKPTKAKTKNDLSIGPIEAPPEQLDEVQSWMDFYERKVIKRYADDNASSGELEVV